MMDDLFDRIASGTTTADDCREVERMAAALSTLRLFVHEVSLFCDDEDYADRATRLLNDLYQEGES
jgi:hypothetical protein